MGSEARNLPPPQPLIPGRGRRSSVWETCPHKDPFSVSPSVGESESVRESGRDKVIVSEEWMRVRARESESERECEGE